MLIKLNDHNDGMITIFEAKITFSSGARSLSYLWMDLGVQTHAYAITPLRGCPHNWNEN